MTKTFIALFGDLRPQKLDLHESRVTFGVVPSSYAANMHGYNKQNALDLAYQFSL